jgi:hypothetical protein
VSVFVVKIVGIRRNLKLHAIPIDFIGAECCTPAFDTIHKFNFVIFLNNVIYKIFCPPLFEVHESRLMLILCIFYARGLD